MDQLHDTLDKLLTEMNHLERAVDLHPEEPEDLSLDRTELALSVAKRVRRVSTVLVRQLAAHREQLQPEEGTSNHDRAEDHA